MNTLLLRRLLLAAAAALAAVDSFAGVDIAEPPQPPADPSGCERRAAPEVIADLAAVIESAAAPAALKACTDRYEVFLGADSGGLGCWPAQGRSAVQLLGLEALRGTGFAVAAFPSAGRTLLIHRAAIGSAGSVEELCRNGAVVTHAAIGAAVRRAAFAKEREIIERILREPNRVGFE